MKTLDEAKNLYKQYKEKIPSEFSNYDLTLAVTDEGKLRIHNNSQTVHLNQHELVTLIGYLDTNGLLEAILPKK